MEEILSIKNLCKSFRKHKVLTSINLSVKKGEIYGVVGNNGAGKTTLFKILCGLLPASGGTVEFSPALTQNGVGTLIENAGLFKDMNAFENLKAKALCLGKKYTDAQIDELIRLVGLESAGKKNVLRYSMGMKQRLGIALALIGDPELLILDEPLNNLDPQGIAEVRNLLIRLNKERGITVILSSHILEELVKTATQFCILNDGEFVKQYSTEQLLAECGDRPIDEYYIEIVSGAH